MRNATLIPLLVIPFTLVGCGQPRPDARGVDRDETFVRTTGAARAEATPDEARFEAGVSAIDATGPAASAANARKMSVVVAALKAAGIEEKDIQTRNLSISRIDYGANRGKFEAKNVVAVRVRAVDKAGEAIAGATGAGANVLSGPDLRVSDPVATTRAAYADAYRAARTRADAYAEAAGLKVVRVLAITDGSSGEVPQYGTAANIPAPVVVTPVVRPPALTGTNEAQVAVVADFALEK